MLKRNIGEVAGFGNVAEDDFAVGSPKIVYLMNQNFIRVPAEQSVVTVVFAVSVDVMLDKEH